MQRDLFLIRIIERDYLDPGKIDQIKKQIRFYARELLIKIAPSIIYLRATTMAAAVEKFIERVPYR